MLTPDWLIVGYRSFGMTNRPQLQGWSMEMEPVIRPETLWPATKER